ncbi:unnamed protein product [Albugo candida]|uniref:C3H1-type domain-containing protein n=1 Tax=Albugo candida TaxID=65357 RepID=A0A024FUJ7_9STRA|nr:unnamed protein product [Albugo candida]|eukprot:CCI10828.1 unnamed protein product [Albugo candida]
MVLRSSFIPILMELLIINAGASKIGRLQSASSYSRLLAVTTAQVEDCHTCLLRNVGVERITLVASNKITRIYLIKSRVTVLESFLNQCNNEKSCQLQTDIDMFPPWSSILWRNPVLEVAISRFSMHINDITLDPSRDKKVVSNLESYRGIAFFFFDEIQKMHIRRHRTVKTRNAQLERKQIDKSTYQHSSVGNILIAQDPAVRESPSLARCFYSYSRRFQCERCLALHSISLGVRAYPFKKLKKGLDFVFAFASFHTHGKIQENCAKKYCLSLNSLSSAACDNLDRMFPQDKKTLHDDGTSANGAENQIEIVPPNHSQASISSQEDIYFRYIASDLDFGSDLGTELDTPTKNVKLGIEIQVIEQFLSQTEISCMRVRRDQNDRLFFLRCLSESAGNDNPIFLVRSSSLTELILFFKSSLLKVDFARNCFEEYGGSDIVPLLNPPSFCDYYRIKYKIKSNTYPELRTLTKTKPQTELCVLVSHITSKYKSCGRCVKTFFDPMYKGWVSMPPTHSSLWKDSKERNPSTMVDNVLLHCIRTKRCSKIQLYPKMVCKMHEEIMELHVKGNVINEKSMSKFDRMTDRVWPSADPHLSGSENLLDRPALMIVYDAIDPKECLRCLILCTQVFYSYKFKGNRRGYIWMHQSSSDLLSPCISGNSCTELWHDETAEQLAISDDMRPWSVVDIGDLNDF